MYVKCIFFSEHFLRDGELNTLYLGRRVLIKKIRWSWDRFMFIMEFSVVDRRSSGSACHLIVSKIVSMVAANQRRRDMCNMCSHWVN